MKFAGLDIETYGQKPEYALQPWRLRQGTAWLTSVVGVAGNYVLDTIERSSMKEEIRAFLIYCAENHYTITAWNGPFDLAWLIAMGLRKEVFACEWLDGLLLYRHYKRHPTFEGYSDTQKKVSFGLKAAVAEFMPDMAGYEDDVTYNPQTPEEWAKLREYNMRDVRYTIAITANLCNEVRPEQLKLAELESRCLPLVADANLRGLCIDEAATEALSAKLNETSCLAYAKLRLGTAGVTDKVLSSPKQLSELLADWGLPIVKLTGSGQASTDKDVLGQLALRDPRAALIHEYREANTNRTKFATRVLESVEYNGTGRTYPTAQVSGTYCVCGDVEVLTPSGWSALADWSGGDIMQVSEDGSMAFLPATRFVGPVVDDWVRVSARGVKCDFTHGHTMPYLEQKTYRWRTCKAGDMIGGQRHYHIPLAGEWGGYEAGSDAHARVLCAAQADGYWGPKGLQFTLKKSRKVERLRALLDAAEVSYREYVCAAYPDRTEFHIHQRGRPEWLTPDRKVFGAWCLNYNPRAIIDELVHWDGTPHPDGGVKYCSHDPDNLAWVRTLGALCGRKVGLSRSTCHISEARPICTVKTRTHVSTVTNSRRAYCATTQTGYWLARSRGTVFVTGNTGRMTYASSQGRGKAQVPTGIALHQWKRDPEFRSTITPPEGYTLCEFDFAGQEFRWMAVMSRDTTMLNLCFPGEDAHAYMGASIRSINYKALMQKVADGDKEAKGIRQLGKVANLCVAGDTVVLTDRGPSYIVDIHADDLVWDGIEFVSHDGVVCSGYRQVISYEGVTATPEHKVLVDGAWQTIEDAARHSWRVEPAVGTEGSGVRGAAFRIVGGIVRRHIRDTWCTLRTSAMRLWAREADQHSNDGAWSHAVVQRVCDAEAPQANRAPDHSECSRPTPAEARQRNASALHEPQRSIISKLRRAWYRVSVCDGSRVCSVHQEIPAAFHVPEPRHRPSRQRRSLRSWKLALGYAPTKPAQHAPQRQDMMVYDIVNCGPRTRFSANGKIVHNSLQYRTSPPRLRDMARVQFGIDLDPILAKNIHTTYRSTYPGVVRYWKAQANFVKNHSYIVNLIGRRVHLLPPAFRDYEYTWSYEVSAVNFPIQSIGADQKYLALSIMRDELPRWRAYFYYELHDGLFFIVPDELAELFVVHSKHLLSNLPYEKAWGKRLPIPFPVDAKLGKSWGALKEYHG